MRSTEKVAAALDYAENLADDPQADLFVKGAAAMLAAGRGFVEQMIPADPDKLDELLEQGSHWLLRLRSDEEVEADADERPTHAEIVE